MLAGAVFAETGEVREPAAHPKEAPVQPATGAQIGARLGVKIKGEQLRILLAIMVLAVCAKLGFDLVVEPRELFSIGEGGH